RARADAQHRGARPPAKGPRDRPQSAGGFPGRGATSRRPPWLAPVSARSSRRADPPILLVEDKDSLRTMLRHALEAQGHTVVEAMDEPSAIQRMQQARPVVVLTDLKLPEGDGFGVLRAAAELDPELPVVVMT